MAGLSKFDRLTSIAHKAELRNGLEVAEIIAPSFCKVSNDLPPLQFDKAPVDGVPYEFIITSHHVHVKVDLEKICLHKAPGPDNIPNWVLKTCAPILANPICSIFTTSIRQ